MDAASPAGARPGCRGTYLFTRRPVFLGAALRPTMGFTARFPLARWIAMNQMIEPALPGLHRTRIKICGLTREADVDAAVAAGVDAVGFVLYAKSPRAVSAQRAAELARRLPPFVTPVLLFVN